MDFHDATLLLAAHGSSFDREAAAPTYALAERIRCMNVFAGVRAAFWKEAPFLRDALKQIDTEKVFIVPNFISRGYFTETVLPREFAIGGRVSQIAGKTVHYCEPVGTHPLMAEVLLHSALAMRAPARETSLLIAGHGTLRNKNSATVIREQAEKISRGGQFAECLAVFMEEAPFAKDWVALTAKENVVVVPFFIAEGPHYSTDLPRMLGLQDANVGFPVVIGGKKLWYAKPVGQDEKMAEVVLAQAHAACG
jgi:sirohydrochlorin cobaltochelatase